MEGCFAIVCLLRLHDRVSSIDFWSLDRKTPMALRLLGTKLSKRILPRHDLLKVLRPLHARPKTAVISPVEDSFASGCPPRAKRLPYHHASCSHLPSPGKALPGSSLIHGRRNFASGASTTENVLKMNSFKKSSSAPGNDKCPKVKAVERCGCDYCSSQRDIEKFLERFHVFGTWMFGIGIVWKVHDIIQLRREFKALDSDDYEIVLVRRKSKALDSDDH